MPPPPGCGPVLVGLDFSPSAVEALLVARRFAAALGTGVDAMHIMEGRDAPRWGDDAEIARWLARAALPKDAVTLRCGLPWVELARRAQAVQPVMVIVGSHGRTGHHPVALGSTAQRLALISPAPVLIVRAQREPAPAREPPSPVPGSNRPFVPPPSN